MSLNKQGQILQIAAQLLRPLIRLAVREGVGLNEMNELLKRVYIEQAARQLQAEGQKQSDAALSTLTGVHRKDVKRIGAVAPLAQLEGWRKSLLELVQERWSGDVRFINEQGAERPLERRSSLRQAQGGTFDDLIEEVSKGVPTRALLDAWLAQGAVHLDEQGRVCLGDIKRVAGEEFQSLGSTAAIAADRMEAAWENQRPGSRRDNVLFSVRGQGLVAEDLPRLHEMTQQWGRQFGDRLNREVTLAEVRGQAAGGRYRFSFGVQSYAVEISEPSPEAANPASANLNS
ncbi:hypothetical protein HNP55_003521 [Paucibacter oligotrophus]|uniref:Uncharacterized protein n=1 Tax=Roseateles oligotrophus TaxID=1769250 RepID=A0A840LDG7_9BURK|nr:DUF6502 family protein [Roseateles oligotrophus]MBB4844975.1 hypothetical protein [Roseateles oligotrophus]